MYMERNQWLIFILEDGLIKDYIARNNDFSNSWIIILIAFG